MNSKCDSRYAIKAPFIVLIHVAQRRGALRLEHPCASLCCWSVAMPGTESQMLVHHPELSHALLLVPLHCSQLSRALQEKSPLA